MQPSDSQNIDHAINTINFHDPIENTAIQANLATPTLIYTLFTPCTGTMLVDNQQLTALSSRNHLRSLSFPQTCGDMPMSSWSLRCQHDSPGEHSIPRDIITHKTGCSTSETVHDADQGTEFIVIEPIQSAIPVAVLETGIS